MMYFEGILYVRIVYKFSTRVVSVFFLRYRVQFAENLNFIGVFHDNNSGQLPYVARTRSRFLLHGKYSRLSCFLAAI